MTDLDTFRAETRAWLEANCPPGDAPADARREGRLLGRAQLDRSSRDAQQQWLDAMAARGWTVPDWPKEYGGGGLSPAETKILKEEMAADRRAAAADQLRHFDARAGAAQISAPRSRRSTILTEIARGEIRWCQGYSEPGAGSRPRRPADQGRGQGRPLAGQRPEGVDQLCRPGRLDLLPGPHLDRVQARRDQLPAVRHGDARASRPSRSC